MTLNNYSPSNFKTWWIEVARDQNIVIINCASLKLWHAVQSKHQNVLFGMKAQVYKWLNRAYYKGSKGLDRHILRGLIAKLWTFIAPGPMESQLQSLDWGSNCFFLILVRNRITNLVHKQISSGMVLAENQCS